METIKTALITGGSRGIGEAIVRLFSKKGWTVYFTYVANAEAANTVAIDTGAQAIRSDVGNSNDIGDLFRFLDADKVSLDCLVNNAGITGPKRRLDEVTPDLLAEISRVNFAGPVLMAKEAIKRMSTLHSGRGGSIINISSTATALGSPNQWIDYAALKGAIDIMTNGLAREIGKEGIRVNAVAPGYTMTDPEREIQITERFQSMRHEVPLNRIGTTDEVAQAVFWLASDAASYITGTVLPAAGGR